MSGNSGRATIKGMDVAEVMEQVKQEAGTVPQRIQVDNGSEFFSKALDKWTYDKKVTLDFSRPGKPTNNPYIERSAAFNGTFRDEYLNVNGSLSLDDTQEKIEAWRKEYNCFRPHISLRDLTLEEAIEKLNLSPFS